VDSTPNLAARLQGLAAAGQIVIAISTRRLVGSAFELTNRPEDARRLLSGASGVPVAGFAALH
jgi:class 3 adenylate cyclase